MQEMKQRERLNDKPRIGMSYDAQMRYLINRYSDTIILKLIGYMQDTQLKMHNCNHANLNHIHTSRNFLK